MMITRRQMLKWIAAGTATAVLGHVGDAHAEPMRSDPSWVPVAPDPPGEDSWELFGRAIHTVVVYAEASTRSERRATYTRDQSFPILGEVRAPFSAHNDLWYQTEEGYVHSAWVLPIRVYPEQPFIETMSEFGFWGEVSSIYTEAYTLPSTGSGRKYRFYGGTVFHVLESLRDDEEVGWYKVADDYPPRQNTNHQWVLARDLRRIPRAEMAPIHPFVGNKRIEVDLQAQTLTCFEGDERVFTTLVASGLGGGLATTSGEQCVILKQPSRHMSNVPYPGMESQEVSSGDIFDLPGIPWNIFFNLHGQAIHGTYWHNDFGIRRSHGCLNVSCDAAHWIYRWVTPIGGYEDDFIQGNCRVGTPIIIS
ncbi:MAG: L,D-transpeptidase family protein [Anaerolineae bacterium]